MATSGYIPDFKTPIGWDKKDFRESFKTENSHFVTLEKFDWNGTVSSIENRLILGDNLAIMRALPAESIDLIYIDPPFFSGRNYECIFSDSDEIRTFSDVWDGGLPIYLAWMNARLWEMKRLLKPTGSLFVHLDWHAVHYVKCELDKVFGYNNFVNEIIWAYATGGASKQKFARKHDNILMYQKGKTFKFYPNRILEDRTNKSLKRAQNPNGARISSNNLKKLPTDVWQIQALNAVANERIGYPTQKPEEMLKKIILGCTDEGDVVADFFSGGGTTVAVAEKLGRKWLGVDVSKIAISIARNRIASAYKKKLESNQSIQNQIVAFW
jgi:DNA modification methylase